MLMHGAFSKSPSAQSYGTARSKKLSSLVSASKLSTRPPKVPRKPISNVIAGRCPLQAMAKDKERAINPAQAQRKLEKQKAVRKGKAEALARRNEKLARRNPERIQRQIDEIKAIEESKQPLQPRERQVLEELERDLQAVKKARDALGDKAPKSGSGDFRRRPPGSRGRGDGVLGKRRREDDTQWKESDGSETDESVRKIPMPKDTPPPIPRQHPRRPGPTEGRGSEVERQPHSLPARPDAPMSKTVYEAAPVIRNLRQEAVSKFVPTIVRRKQEAIRGEGKLVEPEEMDRLEKAGYAPGPGEAVPERSNTKMGESRPAGEETFTQSNSVQIEDVEDEDA
jgi:WW domain binding protein 11